MHGERVLPLPARRTTYRKDTSMKLVDRHGGRRIPARFGVAAIISGAVVAAAALVLTGSSGKGVDTLALSGNASGSSQMSSTVASSDDPGAWRQRLG